MNGATLKLQLIALDDQARAYRAIRKALGVLPIGHIEHTGLDPVFVEDEPDASLTLDSGPIFYTIASLRSAAQNFVELYDAEPGRGIIDLPRIKQARTAIAKADEVLGGTCWERPS